ncbi:hypothetical protein GIB67_026457 [Kingdonia uniflora]|uniref:Uncharacterized protein n=1 Tax=Kingdonia uniflora TaxID=39325 RepID=A0A7J7P693_9MAGN|nr:hypothetical protein GIB67_026457 [Kingdonia uniflora]
MEYPPTEAISLNKANFYHHATNLFKHCTYLYMVHSNRPTMENYYNNIYFIALQIYTLSEDRLLSQSIRSGRDAIQLCNIQYMSHHGRSARPITGIYYIALQIYTLSKDRLLSQSIRSGRDIIQLCNI